MNFYNDINDNTYFATPKSAIFMRQSELSKMFFVFKSLWVIFFEWRYWKDGKIELSINQKYVI